MKKYVTRLLLASFIAGGCINLVHASSLLEKLRNMTLSQLQRFENGELRCFPELKSEAEAHIIYSYSGVDLVQEGGGGHPPKYLNVRIEKTDKPALLVFSAYEPIVWRVNIAEGANVAGVYMSGYYEQMITGLPQGMPVTRTQYGFRNGEKNEKCLLSGPEASDESSAKLTRKQAKAQFNKLNEELLPLGKKIYKDITELGGHRDMREKLVSDNADEKTLILIDKVIADKTKEIEALQHKAGEIRNRIIDLRDQFKNTSAGKRTELAGYFPLNKLDNFAKFVEILAEEYSISVASYEKVNNPRRLELDMVISSESSQKFRDMKASGKKRLDALEMPIFDLVDLDKPHLAAPSDYVAGGGLEYLAKKGYLLNDDRAGKYHCERVNALSASKGIEQIKCGFHKKDYTIVGPIVFPVGLCGAHSVTFFVPLGAPKPKGDPCHSAIIFLKEK